jgi:branched-chain amino acid transport system ATP-binding protein
VADVLALAGVTAGYGATVILEDVGFSLARASALAVLGRNGMGKTTLMRTIAGHADRHQGRIVLDGQDVGTLRPWRRARRGLGYVPQERDIFASLTVLENLEVGARPGAWTLDRVFALFPSLAGRRRNLGSQLSGGEQQMLSIARALMGQPAVLLLDEPFEGLAPNLVELLVDAFGALRRAGLSMVLVEQRAKLALGMTDTALVLVRGRVALAAESRRLIEDDEALEAVLTVKSKIGD